MSVKLKIIIGAIAAVVVLLLMLLWAFFAFEGKAPMDPFINEISALITIVVGLVAAFFGHQAASPGVVDAVDPVAPPVRSAAAQVPATMLFSGPTAPQVQPAASGAPPVTVQPPQ